MSIKPSYRNLATSVTKTTINPARHAHLNDRSYIQALCKPSAALETVRNAPKESLFGVMSSRDNLETLGWRERDQPDSMFFKNILSERKQPQVFKSARKPGQEESPERRGGRYGEAHAEHSILKLI